MKRYRQLSLAEREQLYALIRCGKPLWKIALGLGRSHSSLSRELRRNVRYGNEYFENEYLPCRAQELSVKRKVKQRKKALLKDPLIYRYVKKHLIEDGWSPEIIAGRLAIDHPGESITKETIYRYIYSKQYQARGNGVAKTKPLSTYLPLARKRQNSKEKRGVENMNGRIRRFIPKGESLDTISEETIQAIEYRLNHTPGKCLAFRTPCEKMQQALHKPHWWTSQ